MRILICGGGFANKGAEAMLRTVQVELGKRITGAEFLVWRPNPWEVRAAHCLGLKPVADSSAEGVRRWSRRLGNRLGRYAWAICELAKAGDTRVFSAALSRQRLVELASASALSRSRSRVDAIVDISGFAYGDDWGLGAFSRCAPLLELSRQQGTPVVFLPQAWGTFQTPAVRNAVQRMLAGRQVRYFSRDEVSSRHLERVLNLEEGSLQACPDIAFRFVGGTEQQGTEILRRMGCSGQRPLVGIAPNMRVFERLAKCGKHELFVAVFSRFIQTCIDVTDADVILHANEAEPSGTGPDDRFLCGLLAASVGRPHRCFSSGTVLGADESWALLGRLSYLLGSRYHSLVFALTQAVPCMAVGWSHKYAALLKQFGLEEDVLDFGQVTAEELTRRWERCWSVRQERAQDLSRQVKALMSRVDGVFDETAGFLTQCRVAKLD